MFWHGGPFYFRLTVFVNAILFKNMIMVSGVFFQGCFNGFSGYQSIPDLLYSLVVINMSLFAIAFYVSFNQQVSFYKYGTGYEAEAKLSFTLDKLYVSLMEQSGNFIMDFIFLSIWGFLCGMFMYFTWYMFERSGGMLNADGITTDIESFGVFNVTVISIIAHTNIMRYVRHWDPWYVFWFIFSIIWIPFNLWNETIIPESRVRGSIGSHMFFNLSYVLNMLMVVSVIMVPLIITRLRRTNYLEPNLYTGEC